MQISQSIWINFRMLLWPIGMLKVMINFLHMINIQEIGPYIGDVMKYTFSAGLHSEVYKLIFFCRPGMLLNTSELCSLIPVLVILTWVQRKLGLPQPSVWKWHEAAKTSAMVIV